MEFQKGRIEVVEGDITKLDADVIVNAANSSLLGGGGVDGAIHRAGGPEILNECRKIIFKTGSCKTGEAVITTAGKLPSKYVIHTVGPVWNGGTKDEPLLLQKCYLNSLQLAVENNCRTIAFPGISTGVYRFPKKEAARIAVSAVHQFLLQTDKIDKVILVCFDEEYENVLKDELAKIKTS